MPPRRLSLFPLLLLLALATPASAQDDARARRSPACIFRQGFDQVVYKGLVGNVLDAIPMDPVGSPGPSAHQCSRKQHHARPFAGRIGGIEQSGSAAGGIRLGHVGRIEHQAGRGGREPRGRLRANPAAALRAQEHVVALLRHRIRRERHARERGARAGFAEFEFRRGFGRGRPATPRVIKIWLPQRSPIAAAIVAGAAVSFTARRGQRKHPAPMAIDSSRSGLDWPRVPTPYETDSMGQISAPCAKIAPPAAAAPVRRRPSPQPNQPLILSPSRTWHMDAVPPP